jgi:hypothetical protein
MPMSLLNAGTLQGCVTSSIDERAVFTRTTKGRASRSDCEVSHGKGPGVYGVGWVLCGGEFERTKKFVVIKA